MKKSCIIISSVFMSLFISAIAAPPASAEFLGDRILGVPVAMERKFKLNIHDCEMNYDPRTKTCKVSLAPQEGFQFITNDLKYKSFEKGVANWPYSTVVNVVGTYTGYEISVGQEVTPEVPFAEVKPYIEEMINSYKDNVITVKYLTIR